MGWWEGTVPLTWNDQQWLQNFRMTWSTYPESCLNLILSCTGSAHMTAILFIYHLCFLLCSCKPAVWIEQLWGLLQWKSASPFKRNLCWVFWLASSQEVTNRFVCLGFPSCIERTCIPILCLPIVSFALYNWKRELFLTLTLGELCYYQSSLIWKSC